MNFIIKKIIKRVFEKYLNLQEQLNVQSGLIKLPFGQINHQQINKKLQPFNIQISSSIYKNLSISIPLTQIITKPIKISIEKFEVLIAKKKPTKPQKTQPNITKQTQPIETEKSNDKIEIDQQVNKYSKTIPNNKEQVNTGYIKNMVNRLLYNMEIIFEKIVIKVQKNQQDTNSQGLEKYLSDVEFQIHQLHLRNSLVLLEANIIKKIFNLQQILIKHKFAELVINDFNICLDYNNRKLNIIAILGNILLNVKEIPYKDLQKLIASKKKSNELSSSSKALPSQTTQVKSNQSQPNQKPIQLNFYVKITQSTFQIQNLISLRGEIIQLKLKKYNQKPKDEHITLQKHTQAQVLFKSLLFVHLNEDPYEEKDFLMIRYLPWCEEVKIFSEYEDNILKSSLIKYNLKETHQRQFSNLLRLKKNDSEINSATSFDDKKQETQQKELIKKQIGIHMYYLDLMTDFQIIKKVFDKITKNNELRQLLLVLHLNTERKSQNQISSQKSLIKEQKKNFRRQKICVDFIVYRLMINVRIMQELSVQLYGSFRGGYFLSSNISESHSLTESSLHKHPTKSVFGNEYTHTHTGKHTHKKRSSNKETASRISEPQVERDTSLSKIRSQSSRIKKSNFHQKQPQADKNQQIRLEVIQLCVQSKNYKVLDFGNIELKVSKSKQPKNTQIVASGTHINAELSIKLIKDVIDLVPLVQKEADCILTNLTAFLSKQEVQNKSHSLSVQKPMNNKENLKKSKITIFFKLNEVNLKFGSLVGLNKPNKSNLQKFVWIFLLEISNLSIGVKLRSALKLKFSTMMYVTSPHTLHRISITRNPVDFKVDFKNKKETVLSICNDLQLDLNENCLQILLKYFSQISNESKKKNQNNTISDNDCYFVQFYNTTQKQIQVIQSNEYQASEKSIDLSQFDDNVQNTSGTKDYKLEEKINLLGGESSSSIFWLNEYFIIIVIDGYRSQPISLEFQSLPITQVKTHSKFSSQYEETLKFEQENQRVQNKYNIHFLLNSIGKIQKIILKHNVCFIAYKKLAFISHQNSQLIAYSNLSIQNSQQKITDNYITDNFRNNKFDSIKNLVNPKDLELNYEFLLDLNQQSKNITFTKGFTQGSQINYKVSSLLLRSPNAKPESTIYSMFGIYREIQVQKSKQQNKLSNRLFQSYLYQIRHLQTSYFVQMPFLVIQNNLACEINLEILDKKTQILKLIKLNPLQKKDIYSTSFQSNDNTNFDFYNKQFTMKIKLVSQTKVSQNKNQFIENQVFYQSEQHYFNTFFMVEHQFETLIALRSNKKYQFDKKFVFLRQELMLKTKVLKIESSCRVMNKTNFNFGLKFKRSTLSEVKSPKKQVKYENQLQMNLSQSGSNYVLLPEQCENNYFLCHKNSQMEIINQFRAQQTLEILFENLQQTKIQVHDDMAKQGLIQILSFNFAKKYLNQNLPNQKKYNHLLFRLRLKTIQNHQFIIIENFITFKNLSLQNITLSLQPDSNISKDEEVIFPLPPTTIKKFNNRVVILNNLAQIQALYEELFSFGLDEKTNSTIKNKKIQSDKTLEPCHQKSSQSIFLTIKDKEFQVQQNILLKDLLFSKNNLKQVNLGKKGVKLFALLKDIKGGMIRLFFLEKLFNPNLSYVLLNNQTKRNLLISSDKSQYTHHFVKNPAQKENNKDEEEEKSEKVFIHPRTFSILSSKEDFQILLCDNQGKHLEKTSKQNLEKQGLQMQFHTTQNFQLIDVIDIPEQSNSRKQVSNEPKLSIKTNLISININLYNKIFLNISVSNLGVRILEKNKIDCLVQDISIKNNLTSEHILRIPEESYVLFEGKIFGSDYNTNFILIKNLFVKCKNIIVNLQKDLPYRVISLLKNLIPNASQGQQILNKKYYFDNEGVRLFFQSIQSNQGLQKLKNYLKQQLILIKNIYLHEIHLSLSLDLQNNNFSNVMVIPQYEITNSFMREKNMFKEIGEFYKTNILAKLPKLSFIFTNLKNPLNLIRTMMKLSSALTQKIEQKNILTFDHDEIPENDLYFSLQRWNFMHRNVFIKERSNPEDRSGKEQLLAFLYKNECYYLISNRNFIMMSLNSKNISKDQEGTMIHYESSSEESFGSRLRGKWLPIYENSMMRMLPLKDIEKIKLIRNKKYSQFAIQFKRNITVNICDEYEKCAKLIDTINSLVM